MGEAHFIYDDQCGFCSWLASFFAHRTDISAVGFSEIDSDLESELPAEYQECSHLVTESGVYSCGASIEEALIRADLPPGSSEVFGFLRQFTDYERLREALYSEVADRRGVLGLVFHQESHEAGD